MPPNRPKRTPKPVDRSLPSNRPSATAGEGTGAGAGGGEASSARAWSASRILSRKSAAASKPTECFLALFIVFSTGWNTSYSDEEQQWLIASLPAKYREYERDPETGRLRCPIDPAALFDRPQLKQSISKLRTEIQDGYHEVSWLNQARRATELRALGCFDDYLREQAADTFAAEAQPGGDERSPDRTTEIDSSDGEWGPTPPPHRRERLK